MRPVSRVKDFQIDLPKYQYIAPKGQYPSFSLFYSTLRYYASLIFSNFPSCVPKSGSYHFKFTRADTWNTENNEIHSNHLITPTRHRANSSISMRDVPDFMSAGQILSPYGLPATSKLFENGNEQRHNFSASYSPLHGFDSISYPLATPQSTFKEHTATEDANLHVITHESSLSKGDITIGLGITGLEDLDRGYDGVGDVYELGHPGEEGGGTPVEGTKKRRRNESDVDGEYEAIDHYHFKDIESDRDESTYGGVAIDDEWMSMDESSDDDDDAIGQGGAPVETYEEGCLRRQREREALRRKNLDILSPFPAFGKLSSHIPCAQLTFIR